MLAKPLSYISGYLAYPFFQAVEQFQQIVDLILQDSSFDKKLPIYKGSNQLLTLKKINELQPGQNKGASTEIVILRMINCSYLSFLLGWEAPQPKQHIFYCLIVISPRSLIEKWEQQMGLNMNLLIKQPFLQTQLVNKMRIYITRLQNIVLQPVKRWKDKTEELKLKGNELFNQKDYVNALLHYQYALTCVQSLGGRRLRAILYANASACLYQMKLYNSSIKYAEISIKIDKSYPKGYFRKINALLEKKAFKQIPSLILLCKDKMEAKKFLSINKKYSAYVANSLGLFNWMEYLKSQQNQMQICDYLSKKVFIREEAGMCVITAKENIQAYEMIMISKPIFEVKVKKGVTPNMHDYCNQLLHRIIFQKSFMQQICMIFFKNLDYRKLKGQNSEFQTSFQSHFNLISDIHKNPDQSNQLYAIWPDLHTFQHSCRPNCSYGYFRNLLFVSSAKRIPAGSILTLDCCAYDAQLNRKQKLKSKYKIRCDCDGCQWQWWPRNSGQYLQMMEVVKQIENTAIKKQFFWIFLKNASNIDKFETKLLCQDALNNYMSLISKETHWVDVYNMKMLLQFASMAEGRNNITKFIEERKAVLFRIYPSQKNSKILKHFI